MNYCHVLLSDLERNMAHGSAHVQRFNNVRSIKEVVRGDGLICCKHFNDYFSAYTLGGFFKLQTATS